MQSKESDSTPNFFCLKDKAVNKETAKTPKQQQETFKEKQQQIAAADVEKEQKVQYSQIMTSDNRLANSFAPFGLCSVPRIPFMPPQAIPTYVPKYTPNDEC